MLPGEIVGRREPTAVGLGDFLVGMGCGLLPNRPDEPRDLLPVAPAPQGHEEMGEDEGEMDEGHDQGGKGHEGQPQDLRVEPVFLMPASSPMPPLESDST